MQSSKTDTFEARWVARRNAILASPVFRRWALRLPFTRGISRRRADAMFSINAGFVYTQIALAMVETRLIVKLGEAPLTLADAAQHANLPDDATDRLLKGAAALDIAQRLSDGRYMLGQLGAVMNADRGITAMIDHHRHLYADLHDPVALLRSGGGGGALQSYWAYARVQDPAASGSEAVSDYSALMAASQAMVAEQVVGVYPFARHRRLLDVGGGEGVFVRAVRAANPTIDVALFDLPAVAARAGAIPVHGGNFFTDSLPHGFDLISLVRILHDHDDEPALILLRNIYAALPRGGRILIAEPMADTSSARAMGDAYFGFYLWAMGSGRPRSAREITAMLRDAGFARVREVRTHLPLVTRVMTAERIGL